MEEWKQYTLEQFTHVTLGGDHYFVSTKYKEVLILHPMHNHDQGGAFRG